MRSAVTAPEYARLHAREIMTAVAKHLAAANLPEPHPRLRWASQATAVATILEEVGLAVRAGGGRLYELAYPADLWKLIDELRGAPPDPSRPRSSPADVRGGPLGTSRWEPTIGAATANVLDEPIVSSIRRMGMRLRVQLDSPIDVRTASPIVAGSTAANSPAVPPATSREITTGDLVASRPIDRLVASALARAGLVDDVAPPRGKTPDDTPGRPFFHGIHQVAYEWLGARDPQLWNWIRVTAPANPTAEHVAHTIYTRSFDDPAASRSDQAFQLIASPPYFGIPVATARQIPEAWTHAPPAMKTPLAATDPAAPIASVLDLATSSIADELALAQAQAQRPADRADRAGLTKRAGRDDGQHAIDRVHVQLGFLQARLAPWKADRGLAGALGFAARRRAEEAYDARAIDRWTAVAVAQEQLLHVIASEVSQLLAELARRGVTTDDLDGLDPVQQLLAAYASAAGLSHLQREGRAALAAAHRQRALLPLALTEDRIRIAREAIAAQRAEQVREGRAPAGAREIIDRAPVLGERAAALRARANRGQTIDADALEELAVDADEAALRARVMKRTIQLDAVDRRAEAAGLADVTIQRGYWTVRGVTARMRAEVRTWQAALDLIRTERVVYAPAPDLDKTAAQRRIEHKRRAVGSLAQQIAGFDRSASIADHLVWAHESIADRQLRDAISSIAVEIGVMIATGQAAGAVVAGARGLAMARSAATAASLIRNGRAARAFTAGLEAVTHAGLATAAQGALGKPAGARAFAENLLGNALTSAAMRPFKGLFKDTVLIEQEVRTWAELAARGGRIVAKGALNVSAGIAASHVAHSITHLDQLSMTDRDEVTVQGLAFVAAKLVQRRGAAMNARIAAAAKATGTRLFERLQQRSTALSQRAAASGHNVSPETAIDLLTNQRRLLLDERDLYAQLARDGRTVDASQNAEALGAVGADFAEVPLRIARLRSVVGDQIFEGTAPQIERAFQIAEQTGVPMTHTRDRAAGIWKVTAGARQFEIRERAPTPAARPHAPEIDAPSNSRPTHRDQRTRVTADRVSALEKQLGVPVTIADDLVDGVELRYRRTRGTLGIGTDIQPTVLRVGKHALVGDILAHGATIQRVTRYNSLVGKLRGLWDRLVARNRGTINPFLRGSRGWESFEELRKLDHLIGQRLDTWHPDTLDRATLDAEIAFLDGRRAYHEEILRSAEDTRALGGGHVDGPDTGKVTAEALARGYRLPGPAESANPDWYYYRNKAAAPNEYELALKPSAPADARSYRAVTAGGKFSGLATGEIHRASTQITSAWTDTEVVAHLWSDPHFSSYALMLVRHGITPDRREINAAIRTLRRRSDPIADDTLRLNVKAQFRDDLIAHLTDPRLDQNASWNRMREIVADLGNADRGNLAEIWYQARYAPRAEHHVAVQVERSGMGVAEKRVIDLFDGKRAIEIKDIEGPIDRDQFKAYVEMMTNETPAKFGGETRRVEALQYVFTRPDGARANLEFFANQFDHQGLRGRLSVEVFDHKGTRHVLTSKQQALVLLDALGGRS